MNGQNLQSREACRVVTRFALLRAGREAGWRGAKRMIRGTNTGHRTAHSMAWHGMAWHGIAVAYDRRREACCRQHSFFLSLFYFGGLELLVVRGWVGAVHGVSRDWGVELAIRRSTKQGKEEGRRSLAPSFPPFVDQGPGSARGIQPEPWDPPWGHHLCREREACQCLCGR